MLVHATTMEQLTTIKGITTYSYYTMATLYYILSFWSYFLCSVKCSLVILSVHAHLSIRDYQCLLKDNLATWDKFIPRLATVTVTVVANYCALLLELLLVDMDRSCMRNRFQSTYLYSDITSCKKEKFIS